MAHTVCWQKAHSSQGLVEDWVLEHVSSRDEVHTSVRKLKTYAQRVVEAVLVVGYHDTGSAIDRYILKADDMLLAEVETRVYILQI